MNAQQTTGEPQSAAKTPNGPQMLPFMLTPEQFVNALFQVAMGQTQNGPPAQPPNAQAKLWMYELAGQVAALDVQLKLLQKQKRAAVLNLLPMIQQHGAGSKVILADGTEVIACVQNDKRAKKDAIVAFFGVEKAQKFWDSITSKVREYISIKRPNVEPDGDDEEGGE